MKFLYKQKGFTLVELLIYMGLLSLILVILTTLFVSVLDIQAETGSTSTIEQDANYIMSRLTYDMHQVTSYSSITTPPRGTTNNPSNSMQITINGINYLYNLNNGILQLTKSGSTYNLSSYTNTISNLQFQRITDAKDKDTIKVSFTITSTIVRNSGVESKSYETVIGLW